LQRRKMNASRSGCANCKKKTLLIAKCRCDKTVCLSCRAPEDHKCSFDHKAEFKLKLDKENPLIVNEKIAKI
jgi:hypothetical protein